VRTILLLAVALGCATPPLRADPPIATDDATILDPGKCQVEGLLQRQRGGSARDLFLEFACNFTGKLELALGRDMAKSADGDSRATMLQGKYLLRPIETGEPGFAIAAGVSRQRQQSETHRLNPFINLVGSVAVLEKRAALHANLGALRDGSENRTRATWGLAGEFTYNEPLQLVAEMTGQKGSKPAPLAGFRIHAIPERLNFSVALGRRSGLLGFHFEY
jgi:hypothetical protein